MPMTAATGRGGGAEAGGVGKEVETAATVT